MSSEGWIKLHREIFDTDIWHDVTTFRLFIYLIGKASHKDGHKYKGLILNEGQYVRSYRKLADDLSYKEGRGYKKYAISTIKNCVQKLIDAERVNVRETELGTLFTIVNYSKYQELDRGKKRSPNTLNEEVRTNAELTPNEVRTNAEQYQELKNLRIKELKRTTTSPPGMLDENLAEIINTFDSNICPLSIMQRDSLAMWYDDFDKNKDIILEAIKIADDRNRRNFGFVEYLLKEWSNNKLTSVEQVHTYERNKFPKPNQNFKGRKPIRNEKLPDWFVKQKESQQTQAVADQEDDFDYEAEKRRLEEKFKEA